MNARCLLRDFDKAIDAILESGFDVREQPRLREYFRQLVERIYREEVPLQQVTPLSVQNSQVAMNGGQSTPSQQPQIAFREQKFEPSPLDELSKLDLSPDNKKRPVGPNTCSEDQARKIEIRNFRLGMTIQEVKGSIPSLRVPPADKYGHTQADIALRQINPSLLKGDFKGVTYASFEFMDGGLTALTLFYDSAIKWNNADEFISRISDALNLSNNWKPYRSEDSYKIGELKSLNCGKYTLVAGLTLVNYKRVPIIYLWDTQASDTLIQRWAAEVERKKQLEEERRKSFKP